MEAPSKLYYPMIVDQLTGVVVIIITFHSSNPSALS